LVRRREHRAFQHHTRAYSSRPIRFSAGTAPTHASPKAATTSDISIRFGDLDLVFGAAKLNLKIVDTPIRYRERTYGATNIQRWRRGRLVLGTLLFGARRLGFR